MIPYWKTWLAKWPTVADLAKADVEVRATLIVAAYGMIDVNALTGSQLCMERTGLLPPCEEPVSWSTKSHERCQIPRYAWIQSTTELPVEHWATAGRLPDDPVVLEKEIDGIGRYTAGAICSMAYGIRTPIVDGNIHRLFCRLLALYAPATLPVLIKKLWSTAQELVDSIDDGNRAGDLNQALMELGSQICKPSNPDCGNCPLRPGCNAYSEVSPTKSL